MAAGVLSPDAVSVRCEIIFLSVCDAVCPCATVLVCVAVVRGVFFIFLRREDFFNSIFFLGWLARSFAFAHSAI